MRDSIIDFFKFFGLTIGLYDQEKFAERKAFYLGKELFLKYQAYTMIPLISYIDNLNVAKLAEKLQGSVVECGVWRGGMIAGIAELLGNEKRYWLFDSFEGLPEAKEIDGQAAIDWQKKPGGQFYYDNCRAEENYARDAITLSGTQHVEIVKGWFQDTVKNSNTGPISLLRLDGDWYESTLTCLEAFYSRIVDGGIVIIDDYYQWDGCARAVHDFLSKHSIPDRIHQSKYGVAYIIKNKIINSLS